MFGVIICPKCSTAQGADLSISFSSCKRCRKKIDVRKAKVFFSTDSESELAEAVRLICQRATPTLDPSDETIRTWDEGSRKEKNEIKLKEDEEGLSALARNLTGKKGEFDRKDVARSLSLDDEEEIDRIIDLMISHGIVYEVVRGKFRSV